MKFLKYALIIVVSFVALILIVAAFLPDEYTVTRSIEIEASPEYVAEKAADFSIRDQWDPWMAKDSTATSTHSLSPGHVGSNWSWKGQQIGVGSLTILEFVAGESIKSKLEVKVPFEMQSWIFWDFSGDSTTTTVKWTNSGELEYPLFRLMGTGIEDNLGKTFEQGLDRFKAMVENSGKMTVAPIDTVDIQ
jgi:hypothetical protein